MRLTAAWKFPTLSTRRLTLRVPTAADAAAFQVLLSIPDVTRHSNWPDAPSKAQGERYLRWMSKLYASGKGCAWIIEDRDSGDAREVDSPLAISEKTWVQHPLCRA